MTKYFDNVTSPNITMVKCGKQKIKFITQFIACQLLYIICVLGFQTETHADE